MIDYSDMVKIKAQAQAAMKGNNLFQHDYNARKTQMQDVLIDLGV
jgi:hypothetical protein